MTLRKVPSIPPEAWKPVVGAPGEAPRPLERFFVIAASSGVLMLGAAVVALLWANSPWGDSYAQFWQVPIALRFGDLALERNLQWLINDVLMVLFFFLIGLELRRELHQGELSESGRAALPLAAAIGGMVGPPVLYLLIAHASGLRAGFGVPIATDLAFAVGLLSLLGRRVPASVRVLLLALAVLDGVGASLAIALFYSEGVGFGGLCLAAAGLASIFMLRRLGVRPKVAYLVPALLTWAGVSMAGIHPTIAGVILGLLTPVEARLGPRGFVWRMQRELKIFERSGPDQPNNHQLPLTLREVERTRREAMSPADSLLEPLHPLVAFGILPLFALANAGLSLRGLSLDGASARAATGVALALVLGKPLGVLLGCGVALRLRLASLPSGLRARQLALLGAVGGVGFTMPLFLAQLAFADARVLLAAKLGILTGSALAAALALALGLWLFPSGKGAAAAPARALPAH